MRSTTAIISITFLLLIGQLTFASGRSFAIPNADITFTKYFNRDSNQWENVTAQALMFNPSQGPDTKVIVADLNNMRYKVFYYWGTIDNGVIKLSANFFNIMCSNAAIAHITHDIEDWQQINEATKTHIYFNNDSLLLDRRDLTLYEQEDLYVYKSSYLTCQQHLSSL